MEDNPSDEQRWTPPSNEELPGGSTPTPYAGAQPSSGKATAALVLGILGLLLCPLLAPVALAFGYSGRNEIDASGGRLGNRGLATAGIVLGWIGIGLVLLAVLIFIVVIIGAAAVGDFGATSAIVALLT